MKAYLPLIFAQLMVAAHLWSQTPTPKPLPDKIVTLGQFKFPGEVPFTPGMKLIEVMNASSIDGFANLKNFYLIRCGKPEKIDFARLRSHPEEDPELQPWDILYLPAPVF